MPQSSVKGFNFKNLPIEKAAEIKIEMEHLKEAERTETATKETEVIISQNQKVNPIQVN